MITDRGAFFTKDYPNFFARIGVSQAEADARVDACFDAIFQDPAETFYRDVDADSGCLEDTGNRDARTEGMSYGMMMCAQMNRKDLFDRLWTFSKRYMYQTSGKYEGYFAWSVGLDGHHNSEGPAPDGEEYFACALFMASARWGDGTGIFHYSAQAREILRHCLHQQDIAEGGQPMWDPARGLIKFVPESPFSDPSYHLPHFYELFARRADEADRAFWKQAAEKSRAYIALSAHPATGMCPEYAEFDGTPRRMFGKPYTFYSDAYRVAMNIALDRLWFGETPALSEIARNLQRFFTLRARPDDLRSYDIDGAAYDEPAMHPTAIIATTAAAGIAAENQHTDEWLRRFFETPPRKGPRRYYDNCLYFFCLSMLSGRYRIYG